MGVGAGGMEKVSRATIYYVVLVYLRGAAQLWMTFTVSLELRKNFPKRDF